MHTKYGSTVYFVRSCIGFMCELKFFTKKWFVATGNSLDNASNGYFQREKARKCQERNTKPETINILR